MSEQNIWNLLRSNGLSEAGAAAIMGNMMCESNLIACRLQGDFTPKYSKSQEYARQVDSGVLSKSDFVYRGPNGGGWGLIQFTYPSRKAGLYDFVKAKGVSIGDETAQVLYVIKELQTEYAGLYTYLKSTMDLNAATSRVCKEYERPAYNNIADRQREAQKIYNKYKSDATVQYEVAATLSLTGRELYYGCVGEDVRILQKSLIKLGFSCGVYGADGEFGQGTRAAVVAFQNTHALDSDGIVGRLTKTEINKCLMP